MQRQRGVKTFEMDESGRKKDLNLVPAEPQKVLKVESIHEVSSSEPGFEGFVEKAFNDVEAMSAEEQGAYWAAKFKHDMVNYEPIEMDAKDPLAHIDVEAYLDDQKADWFTLPPELKGITMDFEQVIYPPVLSKHMRNKIHPMKWAKVRLNPKQFNFTDAQWTFFRKLVGNRYDAKKNELKIVCDDFETAKENVEGIKLTLVDIVNEVRRH